MNDQSDLFVFLQLVFGIWGVFCFFAIPIYLKIIADNTKRMADSLRAIEKGDD